MEKAYQKMSQFHRKCSEKAHKIMLEKTYEILDYLRCNDKDFDYHVFKAMIVGYHFSLDERIKVWESVDGNLHCTFVTLREALINAKKDKFFIEHLKGNNPDPTKYQLQLKFKIAVEDDDIIKQDELIKQGANPHIGYEGHSYWELALDCKSQKTIKFFKHKKLCSEAYQAVERERKEKELMGEL
ncbi:MAG: hypothetical protein IJV97_05445 [Alphaproteobacteria bacterium]|nr:hypothetical protein [Alphaproteobacteria bacterium]